MFNPNLQSPWAWIYFCLCLDICKRFDRCRHIYSVCAACMNLFATTRHCVTSHEKTAGRNMNCNLFFHLFKFRLVMFGLAVVKPGFGTGRGGRYGPAPGEGSLGVGCRATVTRRSRCPAAARRFRAARPRPAARRRASRLRIMTQDHDHDGVIRWCWIHVPTLADGQKARGHYYPRLRLARALGPRAGPHPMIRCTSAAGPGVTVLPGCPAPAASGSSS